MLQARECKTGTEVLENVKRTRAYFNGLQPPDSERVSAIAQELQTVKAERDQYRALCGELREKIRSFESERAAALAGPASIEKIKALVADHFNLTFEDMCSYSRHPDVLMARHIAMYLCRKLTKNSTLAVARVFGKRDHTTVCHAEKRISDLLQTDSELASFIESLSAKIAQPVVEACE